MNQKINMIRFNRPSQPTTNAGERDSIRADKTVRKGKIQASHAQIPARCRNRICALRRLFADALPILMN